jgi:recombinational DNA repair protein (RecF pathway)
MPARQLQTEAFVLTRQPPADRYRQLTVFSAGHGGLLCLLRIATKSAPGTAMLDLFDETELWLETSNEGRTWFIKETRLLARHDGIGRSYDTLRLASGFAAVITRNPVHEESRDGVYRLLRQTFAAFGSTQRPDLVYLKALYCFARDEGYPVKQQWLPMLPPALRAEAELLLHTSLSALEGSKSENPKSTILQRRLHEYLRGHTEILLD